DIAAAAGADTLYTDESEFGMQGTGLPPRRLGATYTNTDFTIADETDLLDLWHLFVYAKRKYRDAFDQGQLVDTRERRRIVGDYTLSVIDEFAGRTFPDTILIAYSDYDTHGYTIHPLFEVVHPERQGYYVRVPYRCCVPKGLEGLLVGGIGLSVHRDALPLVRMQADMQNLGYALGVAAAMIAETGTLVRSLDIRALQKHLVKVGNLPPEVLTEADSFPLPDEAIAAAVRRLETPEDVAAIMSSPERARPLLRAAYQSEQDKHRRIRYAQMLALLADSAGLDTLIAEVRSYDGWDQGWNYRAMGQFGSAFSRLDTLIVALGRTRARRALPAILEKARLLD
ncbi:MAG TPA: FAD-dependent oxidoreductase, partial [Planctomycetaceae bacterium]|nr:FAD-dependent oxidoreductase [Planctomycetaceae bacterium]